MTAQQSLTIETYYVTNCHKRPQTRTDSVVQPKQHKNDIRFEIWNASIPLQDMFTENRHDTEISVHKLT